MHGVSGTPTNAELREQAARIRAAVLARHVDDGFGAELFDAARLDDVNRLARVSAHWGIASDAPLIGPLVVLWRRALRIMLRWYINPLVEQQNAFNGAVARALFDLDAQNTALRERLAALSPKRGEPDEHSDPA
jgi:hypothetical protein